jgi:hypothetical protein
MSSYPSGQLGYIISVPVVRQRVLEREVDLVGPARDRADRADRRVQEHDVARADAQRAEAVGQVRAAAHPQGLRRTERMTTGGVSACWSAGAAWMRRTTSMPRTTRPKAAKPWPSGLRAPPKSSAGWSPMQMKKSDVAVVGAVARHGERAVLVLDARLVRPLQLDGGPGVLLAPGVDARLHDLDLHVLVGLVVQPDRAVEPPAVVVPGVDVLQEVRRGHGGVRLVDLDLDRAEGRLDHDRRQLRQRRRLRHRLRQDHDRRHPQCHRGPPSSILTRACAGRFPRGKLGRMSIKSDRWITRMAREHGMIEPFSERQVREGVVSYGVSSYGYDVRIADDFKIFTNINSTSSTPRTSTPRSFVDFRATSASSRPTRSRSRRTSSTSASRATCWSSAWASPPTRAAASS